MTTRRLQLNPLAKSLLLEHRMWFQYQEFDSDNNGDAIISDSIPSNLVRFLMVSKSFLYISQHKKIYEFILRKCDETTNWMFECEFGVENEIHEWAVFMLPFEKLQKLIRFLRPQRFYAQLFSMQHIEASEQCKKILDSIDGKIKLRTTSRESKVAPVISILMKKHEQICELSCKAEVLSEVDLVPRMNLETCGLEKLDSFYQLNVILQHHKIKELTLSFDDDYDKKFFQLQHLESQFSPAPLVTKLTLDSIKSSEGLYDDDFLKKAAKLIEFLPNLKDLKCDLNIGNGGITFDYDDVYDFIMNIYNDCRQIQGTVRLGTKLEFKFHENFKIGHAIPFSNEWLVRLRRHQSFVDAENVQNFGQTLQFKHEIKEEKFEFYIHIGFSIPNNDTYVLRHVPNVNGGNNQMEVDQ